MINDLKNTPVRDLIHALEQDGFEYRRRKGSQRVYRHADGRRVVLHYHHAKESPQLAAERNGEAIAP